MSVYLYVGMSLSLCACVSEYRYVRMPASVCVVCVFESVEPRIYGVNTKDQSTLCLRILNL